MLTERHFSLQAENTQGFCTLLSAPASVTSDPENRRGSSLWSLKTLDTQPSGGLFISVLKSLSSQHSTQS